MKNLKRKYVYAVLALPFIAFGVFAATLDPITRDGFFADFKRNTARMLGGESDTELATPADRISDGGPPSEGREFGSPGQGGGGGRRGGGQGGGGGPGGGFDPAAIFQQRDTDGDGKLSGDEIGERLRDRLDQIDSDQDGSVTLDEFQDGMQSMFANRGADGERGGGRGPGGPRGFGGGGFGGDPREGKPDRPQRPEME